jgi:hypothetical protein
MPFMTMDKLAGETSTPKALIIWIGFIGEIYKKSYTENHREITEDQ